MKADGILSVAVAVQQQTVEPVSCGSFDLISDLQQPVRPAGTRMSQARVGIRQPRVRIPRVQPWEGVAADSFLPPRDVVLKYGKQRIRRLDVVQARFQDQPAAVTN